jgi:radical SAM superfamily enzyme YgiQ (UPF0313 family)
MGLLYIGGALERAGHEVRVLDLLVMRPDRDTVRRTVEDFDPAIVGITSVTMNWPDASEILKWAKETKPEIATVAGGPHVTFTWEEIGRSEPWVDYVVMGEGERTVVEFATAIEKRGSAQNIAGLAWRENGAMKAGPQRELEQNLDLLPKPARHLFPLPRYRIMRVEGGLSTGRGCPFSCTFCVGPKMIGHKARLRSPIAVVDEMEELISLGFRQMAFSDDHFGMKRSHAFAVCDQIISRGLNVELSIFIRADAAEPKLLERMRQAGCSKILFGAESGVQKIVDMIKKKTDLNMLREKVKLAKDMGFFVQVTFIMGLPGETKDTIKQTIEYALSLKTFFGLHILAPLPGSEIYEKAEELGLRILHRDWRLYDANHAVTETEGLKADELQRIGAWYDDAFDRMGAMETEAWRRGELTGETLERTEQLRCKSFFWKLLRSGFFEDEDSRIGIIGVENPLQILTAKAASKTGLDEWEAGRWLNNAINSGDLVLSKKGDYWRLGFNDINVRSRA